MTLWHNLPKEMRDRRQWVCSNDRREPRRWDTYELAEVDNPDTWGTFEQVTKAAIWNGCEIGYVLVEDDGLTIIDLDDKPHNPASPEMRSIHQDIVNRADTYIERSIGGHGYHIVVKGKPEFPIKTPHVEMYGSLRMMVCTGKAIKNLAPANGAELIGVIAHHFGRATQSGNAGNLPDWVDGEPVLDDAAVIAKCQNAENGEKFTNLFFAGDLSAYRNDHSAGDSALLNMLCFFTPHNEQVRRIFKSSELYRPDRSNKQDRYMNYSISKWRAEHVPVDLSKLRLPVFEPKDEVDIVATYDEPEARVEVAVDLGPKSDLEYPPGLIGEIARFAFDASYYPLLEGSIPAAITYMAGLIGRSYHIDRSGLNQYMVCLADSGDGKEGAKKAINKIHTKVVAKAQLAKTARLDINFASGVALYKGVLEAPCTVLTLSEVGQRFKAMLSPHAPSYLLEMKTAMLQAWSESGPDGYLNGMGYSDKVKNAEGIRAPCLSILGESVHSAFYDALSMETASDGFLPRWWVFDYRGGRGNPNHGMLQEAPDDLVARIERVFSAAKSHLDKGEFKAVETAPDALKMFRAFEADVNTRIRQYPPESPPKAVLNRTHEKAKRLAALLAACDDQYFPTITAEFASYAIELVKHCDNHMLEKFKDGTVAASGREAEGQFSSMIKEAVDRYLKIDMKKRKPPLHPKKLLEYPSIIPATYLNDFLKRRSVFIKHPLGPLRAAKMAIEAAVEEGILVKLGPQEKQKLGLNQDLFMIGADF